MKGERERENYGELYTNTKTKREMSTESVIVRNTGTDKVRERDRESMCETDAEIKGW